MCCFTNSYPHLSVEVSCELQTPATLPRGRTPVPIKQKAGGPRAHLDITDKSTTFASTSISTHHQSLLSDCNPAIVRHHFQSNSLYEGLQMETLYHSCMWINRQWINSLVPELNAPVNWRRPEFKWLHQGGLRMSRCNIWHWAWHCTLCTYTMFGTTGESCQSSGILGVLTGLMYQHFSQHLSSILEMEAPLKSWYPNINRQHSIISQSTIIFHQLHCENLRPCT
jgi:hypothetical protein